MDLRRLPAGDRGAVVQQDFHQPDHARVVDFDAGEPHGSRRDGKRQSLKQRKVHMHVEPLRLEGGEAVCDGEAPGAHGGEVIDSFFQAEVGQVIGTDLAAQKGGKLLILFNERIPAIRTKDVMAMLDLFERRIELAFRFLVHTGAEDLRDPVGSQAPESDLTAALEDPVNRKVPFENEVPAVFDLADRIEAAQIHGRALAFGELRSEYQSPVIEAFPDLVGGEAIRCRLQGLRIGNGQESVIVLAELHPFPAQFVLDEAVPVQIIRSLERKERRHPQHHRSQGLVANVEVVMREPAALTGEDTVVRIGGRKLRNRGTERVALFHALQNEVDPVPFLALHPAQRGSYIILFANTLRGPLNRAMIPAKRLHPRLILVGAPREDFFADHRLAHYIPEKVRHLARPRKTRQISMNDNPVETVVNKYQQAAKQLRERLHRSSSFALVLTTRSSDRRPVVSKFQISLASTYLQKFHVRRAASPLADTRGF